MTMMIRFSGVFFVAVLLTGILESSAQRNDFELWTSFALRKNIGKSIRLELEEGVRFNQNSTALKKQYSDISVRYELNNYLSARFNYRYVIKNNLYREFSHRHRVNLDLTAGTDIKRWETSLRLRFQKKYIDVFSSDDYYIPDNLLRTKIKAEYDIAKSTLTPEISAEIYHSLNSENLLSHVRTRYTAAVSYELLKKLTGGIYYRIQMQRNRPDPLTSYILGIDFKYRI
jgi:hypothetical protein